MRLATWILPTLWLLACSHAGQAHAQSIYKCVDGKRGVVYQSTPCAQQQKTAAVIGYTVVETDPALAAKSRAVQQEMDRRNREGNRLVFSKGSVRRTTEPNRCQLAKNKRKRELDRVGLKRNYELLSRLDSEVWEVCKGF